MLPAEYDVAGNEDLAKSGGVVPPAGAGCADPGEDVLLAFVIQLASLLIRYVHMSYASKNS